MRWRLALVGLDGYGERDIWDTFNNSSSCNSTHPPHPKSQSQPQPSIERRVLKSNAILESFGNARTLRNDNSSRFGKFLELRFDGVGRLTGAAIDVYLLEKARIAGHAVGERSYHVFYQVLAAAAGGSGSGAFRRNGSSSNGSGKDIDGSELFLEGLTVDDFAITTASDSSDAYSSSKRRNQPQQQRKQPQSNPLPSSSTSSLPSLASLSTSTSSSPSNPPSTPRRTGNDDHLQMFAELTSAMSDVGFDVNERRGVFEVVAGLLHMSNLAREDAFVGEAMMGNEGADDASSTCSNGNPIIVEGQRCALRKNSTSLRAATQLLGVSPKALDGAVTSVQFRAGGSSNTSNDIGGNGGAGGAGGEVVEKALDPFQASRAVSALIKGAYDALFSYLVERINSSIVGSDGNNGGEERNEETQETETESSTNSSTAFVGLLDIFGFESFERNSFEQLCINYCNESLQQQFNRFVFKLEQAEYEKEGIRWDHVDFDDNQDVLDLIDGNKKMASKTMMRMPSMKRGMGMGMGGSILGVLDEQCMLGRRCNDRTFVSAVYDKLLLNANKATATKASTTKASTRPIGSSSSSSTSNSDRFRADTRQRSRGAFSIRHYAGIVEYDSAGFVEKNKDEMPMEASALFSESSHPLVRRLGSVMFTSSKGGSATANGQTADSNTRGRIAPKKKSSISRVSVGAQFSTQLHRLRERIDVTHPHYVRCIKPNDALEPHVFDRDAVVDQLRCGGILEAVRVSRAGFPQRYTVREFLARFGVLAETASTMRRRMMQQEGGGSHQMINHNNNNSKNGSSRDLVQHQQTSWRRPHKLKLGADRFKASSSSASATEGTSSTANSRHRRRHHRSAKDPRKECESLVRSIAAFIVREREKEQRGNGDDNGEENEDENTGNRGPLSPRSFWKSHQSPPKAKNNTTANVNDGGTGAGGVVDDAAMAEEAGIQLGRTKVFLLQDTFDRLERERARVVSRNATKICATARMYLARIAYLVVLRAHRAEAAAAMAMAMAMANNGDEFQHQPTQRPTSLTMMRERSRSDQCIDVQIDAFEEASTTASVLKRAESQPMELQDFKWVSMGHGRFIKRSLSSSSLDFATAMEEFVEGDYKVSDDSEECFHV